MGTLLEEERLPGGDLARALTVFLAGRECPFTCAHCDLWRFTLDGPTPPGALPAQLRAALAEHARDLGEDAHLKLYNASNFFEPGAVPREDLAEISRLCSPFAQVVVENHPRLVGPRCLDFAAGLAGRLQVAMGLETAHPEALARLNKKMELRDFERAAKLLVEGGIGVRAFVLVGAPFVPEESSLDWTVRSAAFAFDVGAEHVALIPVRGGNGELERLANAGLFHPPELSEVEEAFEQALELAERAHAVATVDLWDLERFATCQSCAAVRTERLARMNLSGAPEPRIGCGNCAP